MASIHKFGFEGGFVPNGVNIVGSYMTATGRSGGSSVAVSGIDSSESYVSALMKTAVNEVYASFHLKLSTFGGGQSTMIASFGPTSIRFSLLDSTLTFWSNGQLLQSWAFTFPSNAFVPVRCSFKLHNSIGVVEMVVEGSFYTFNGDTLRGSTDQLPTDLRFGLGAVNGVNSQFTLDDVSINDPISQSNESGSYGVGATGYPNFVRGLRSKIVATGSQFQWIKNDSYSTASIIDIVNGDAGADVYLLSHQYNQLAQFRTAPIDTDELMGFEGINVYTKNAYTIDSSTNTFFETYIASGAISYGEDASTEITSVPRTSANSVLSGLSIDAYNSGALQLITRKFINQNFFGTGESGSIVVTGSQYASASSDGYAIIDCDNLTVTSGSTLTTDIPCKGLIVYVRDTCLIEGTVTMVAKGGSQTEDDSPFVIHKNVSASFNYTTAEYDPSATTNLERSYQPYSLLYSTDYGLSTLTVEDQSGTVGGGGRGGSSSLAQGGSGGTSSYWAGGMGGSGAISTLTGSAAQDFASPSGGLSVVSSSFASGRGANTSGGTIYLIVGRNLIFGSTGKLLATGTNGGDAVGEGGGGGGSGGGSINVFYGRAFYNLSGSINVDGGLGGVGIGCENGHPGGSGSIRIARLLSN